MGIKHNAITRIYTFKQKAIETIRDCVSKLKLYINRCPPTSEMPIALRLISIFLEGLKNKEIHGHLYAKRHTNFHDCYLDSMDFDDSFECAIDEK